MRLRQPSVDLFSAKEHLYRCSAGFVFVALSLRCKLCNLPGELAVCPAVIYCGYRFHSLFLPIFFLFFFSTDIFVLHLFLHPLFFHRPRSQERIVFPTTQQEKKRFLELTGRTYTLVFSSFFLLPYRGHCYWPICCACAKHVRSRKG